MAEGSTLDQLRLRKQALLLESALNRFELGREVEIVRGHLTWLDDPVGAARENSPLLLMLAPVAGVLASSLLHRSPPGRPKLNVFLDCLRVGWPLWRQFAAGYFRTRSGGE
jgi:hypothetical protein